MGKKFNDPWTADEISNDLAVSYDEAVKFAPQYDMSIEQMLRENGRVFRVFSKIITNPETLQSGLICPPFIPSKLWKIFVSEVLIHALQESDDFVAMHEVKPAVVIENALYLNKRAITRDFSKAVSENPEMIAEILSNSLKPFEICSNLLKFPALFENQKVIDTIQNREKDIIDNIGPKPSKRILKQLIALNKLPASLVKEFKARL